MRPKRCMQPRFSSLPYGRSAQNLLRWKYDEIIHYTSSLATTPPFGRHPTCAGPSLAELQLYAVGAGGSIGTMTRCRRRSASQRPRMTAACPAALVATTREMRGRLALDPPGDTDGAQVEGHLVSCIGLVRHAADMPACACVCVRACVPVRACVSACAVPRQSHQAKQPSAGTPELTPEFAGWDGTVGENQLGEGRQRRRVLALRGGSYLASTRDRVVPWPPRLANLDDPTRAATTVSSPWLWLWLWQVERYAYASCGRWQSGEHSHRRRVTLRVARAVPLRPWPCAVRVALAAEEASASGGPESFVFVRVFPSRLATRPPARLRSSALKSGMAV